MPPQVQAQPLVQVQARVGRFVWWLGFLATTFVLTCGSVIAYVDGLPSTVQRVPQLDKVFHFSVFGSIAFFLDGVLRQRAIAIVKGVRPLEVPLAALLVLGPAGVEEYLQRYSSNRTSSIWDFAADMLGVVTSIWLSRRLSR